MVPRLEEKCQTRLSVVHKISKIMAGPIKGYEASLTAYRLSAFFFFSLFLPRALLAVLLRPHVWAAIQNVQSSLKY